MEHSDDGISTGDFAPPKARVRGDGQRTLYIPSRVASQFTTFVRSRHASELLFVNSWGKPLNAGTFRTAWDRVKLKFPEEHRLRRTTPHSLRHAGMTMWLGQGLDLKLIQIWGGWYSLKVMLDTYAALLPGVQQESVDLLEGRGTSSPFRFASSPTFGISER